MIDGLPTDSGKSAEPRTEKPLTVVFDLGGVLIDWNPRDLYRRLPPSSLGSIDAARRMR